MNRVILFLAFLVVGFFAYGQQDDRFRMVGNIDSLSNVNDSTYYVELVLSGDQTGNSFIGQLTQEGYRLYTATKKYYRIDSIYAKSSATVSLRIVEANGTNASPNGRTLVYEYDGSDETIPLVPVNSNGISTAFQSIIITINDGILNSKPGGSAGDNLGNGIATERLRLDTFPLFGSINELDTTRENGILIKDDLIRFHTERNVDGLINSEVGINAGSNFISFDNREVGNATYLGDDALGGVNYWGYFEEGLNRIKVTRDWIGLRKAAGVPTFDTDDDIYAKIFAKNDSLGFSPEDGMVKYFAFLSDITPGGDTLWNGIATDNIDLGAFWISPDGGNSGLSFGAGNRVVFDTDGNGGNGGLQSVFGGMQLIGDDGTNPESRFNAIGGTTPHFAFSFEGQSGEAYVYPDWMGVPQFAGDLNQDFGGAYQLFVNSLTGKLGLKSGGSITYYDESGGGGSSVTLSQVDSLSRYNDAGNNRNGGGSYVSEQYKGAQLSVYGTNKMISAIKYQIQNIGSDKVARWYTDWGASAEITIDQNTVIQEAFDLSAGSTYTLKIIQGVSGGASIGFGPQFNFESPEQTVIPNYPGAVSTFMFTSDGYNLFCHGVLQGGTNGGGGNVQLYRDWEDEYGCKLWVNPNLSSFMSKGQVGAASQKSEFVFAGDSVESMKFLSPWADFQIFRGYVDEDEEVGRHIKFRSNNVGSQTSVDGDSLRFYLNEGTWFARVNVRTDGINMRIADQNDGTGGNSGLMWRRLSGNTLRFFLTDQDHSSNGGASNVLADVTSTWTLTEADGWVDIVVVYDAVDGLSMYKWPLGLESPSETSTASFEATLTPEPVFDYPLRIGARAATGAEDWEGSLAGFLLFDKALDLDQLRKIRRGLDVASPSNNDIGFARRYANDIPPEFLYGLHANWDFNDTSSMYVVNDLSQKVQANNDTIAAIMSPTHNQVLLDSIPNADWGKPVWKSNVQNGLGVAEFVDDTGLSFDDPFEGTEVSISMVVSIDTSTSGLEYAIGTIGPSNFTGFAISANSNSNNPVVDRPFTSILNGATEIKTQGGGGNPRSPLPDGARAGEFMIVQHSMRQVDSFLFWRSSVNGLSLKEGVVKNPSNNGTDSEIRFNYLGGKFTGQIGQCVIHTRMLDKFSETGLRNWLSKKWGIAVNNDLPKSIQEQYGEDVEILVDENDDYYGRQVGSTLVDYHGMVGGVYLDGINWAAWNMRADHNSTQDTSAYGVFMRGFYNNNQPATDLIKIETDKDFGGNEQYINIDAAVSVGDDGNLYVSYISNRTNGIRRRVTKFKKVSPINGQVITDSIVVDTDLQWFTGIGPMIHYQDSLYITGYGDVDNVGDYGIWIFSSPDDGLTWNAYSDGDDGRFLAGETILGGSDDPEEPMLLQTSWGEWIMAYRLDLAQDIRLIFRDSLEGFKTAEVANASHVSVGLGPGKPFIYENSDGILFCMARGLTGRADNGTPNTSAAMWTYSLDRGRTWVEPRLVDEGTAQEESRSYTYGYIFESAPGVIDFVYCAEYKFPSGTGSLIRRRIYLEEEIDNYKQALSKP